jgi:ADP-heptose:LPS heptosyltransferase
LHLAAAVGAPCVGLFGPVPGVRNGPYGPQHVIVQKGCFTGRGRRKAAPELMEAISVADVCAACEQVLARPRQAA